MSRTREWLVGVNSVRGVLENDADHVEELVLDESSTNRRMNELLELAQRADIPVRTSKRSRLDQLSEGRPHQGVAARYRAPGVLTLAQLEELLARDIQSTLLLMLDGIEDPRNLGAMLRTAECAGATAVVVPKHRATSLTAVARKAASGAAERLPLVQCPNLARAIDAVKSWGIWCYGLAGEADRPLYAVDLTGPAALVMGSEGSGLRPVVRKACDELISIPMAGTVGSLNVGAAAAIGLFEVVRQRNVPRQQQAGN